VICLSGVCVSPLWPSETGFCPPPPPPPPPPGRGGGGWEQSSGHLHTGARWPNSGPLDPKMAQ
jgi:hypothetical protein